MSIYTKHMSSVGVSTPIPGKDMIPNADGGYTFQVSGSEMFRRFCILGTESGTYYASEHKLTLDAVKEVIAFIKTHSLESLEILKDIVHGRRAPKPDASIYALALICTYADKDTKLDAYDNISNLLKTSTHLFQFVEAVKSMRGFSRGLNRGIANWYTKKSVEELAYQVVKYRQRNGWTHKDVIRLCHPKMTKAGTSEVIEYVLGKNFYSSLPEIIHAFEIVQKEKNIAAITENRLDREMLPTEYLNDKDIWKALIPHMKDTALVRNLATMTAKGVINNALEDTTSTIIDKIEKVKLHPVNIFIALRTYARGRGIRGSQTWNPISKVQEALDRSYKSSLSVTEGSGKRILVAQDVSGSMAAATLGSVDMPAVEVCAGLLHSLNAVEKKIEFCIFNDYTRPASVPASSSILDITGALKRVLGGSTDLSSPIQYAMDKNMTVDAFVVLTDNEANTGLHLTQKLKEYRNRFNKEAKLVLVSLTSTKNTVRDSLDKNSVEIVGFDSTVPQMITNFIKA